MGPIPKEQNSSDDAGVMDFVYSVTHDLRSPLVNIRALAFELRLALQELEPLKNPHARLDDEQAQKVSTAISKDIPGALEHIDESVSRIINLMSQLTQFSRICHAQIQCSTVDPVSIIDRVKAKLLQENVEATSITVLNLPMVHADPIALEQIFSHLLKNAIQYRAPDRPAIVKVSGWDEGAHSCICIEDNGRGIADSDCARIFAPFRRVGARDSMGNGMGLAVVQALLQRQKGKIICESKIGLGSRFTVLLQKVDQA